jgi:hypothetical protein
MFNPNSALAVDGGSVSSRRLALGARRRRKPSPFSTIGDAAGSG